MTDFTDLTVGESAWREAGEGPPLVFLHGLGGTRESWNPQLRHFASSRRCLAWDMPGYGAAAPEDPLTYATIAYRFAAFLDAANIEAADVVGLSFGGMHALHTALHHPERIGAMVLSNTSPAFGMDGTDPDDWKQSRLGAIDDDTTPGDIAPAVLDAIAGQPLETGIRAELIAAFARISSAGFRAAVECLPHNDIRGDLQAIAHRCLVIAGDLDEETPVSYATVLADGLPTAELVVLEGVGHLSPSEAPAEFNSIVESFLAGC